MSFFKKLVDKVEDLFEDDKDKDKKNEKPADNHGSAPPPPDQTGNRNFGGDQHQQPPYQQYPPQGQYPPQQHQYPPQQHYPPPQGPPAPYGAPPPMPPGWHAQWDQNQNRWYYVEQATGRSQWDPPAVIGSHPPQGPYAPLLVLPLDSLHTRSTASPMPPPPQHGEFGHGSHSGYGGDSGHGEHKKESSGTGKLVAAGVGGAAVGAIGGAIIAHELTEDDNKAAQPVYVASGDSTSYQPAGTYAPPPTHPAYAEELPEETRSGSSVSSSDRESLEERRKELEEAQREYEEAYEETYDD
ncbi:uncharacterized protein B0I36DRAFT_414950 [Microdochium trichocladiopsis]|uniref:WW domain-containing protein n=1 Tax=Microdochium trichocladiopsis TaxID=1682393 RepID=A0A9P9BR15_9PEZI|nr:uncharacterized protein B0I36DRAFT_414950 [Microdochium trichocladiopsis]KAH7026457.1 hypothetical protein B0I36DRAFT_414950 [Microdochium trichocladiopsis]